MRYYKNKWDLVGKKHEWKQTLRDEAHCALLPVVQLTDEEHCALLPVVQLTDEEHWALLPVVQLTVAKSMSTESHLDR